MRHHCWGSVRVRCQFWGDSRVRLKCEVLCIIDYGLINNTSCVGKFFRHINYCVTIVVLFVLEFITVLFT